MSFGRRLAGARFAWPLLACGLLTGAARAQTLPECLALARSHAPLLRASQADAARAEAAIREAEVALNPTLKLSASYVQNSEAPKAVFPIPGRPSPEVVNLGSSTDLDLRADAQYTLYSWGRNPALVRAAEAERDQARTALAETDADLVLRVSQAFYRALGAAQLAEAAQEAESSARSHLAMSAARVRAGVAQRLDSLRAQADLEQRSSGWLRAREAVRLARIALATEIGAPLDSTRALVPPGPPDPRPPEMPRLLTRAVQARPELAALDQQMAGISSRLAAARAARYPQLNLSATAEYTAPNLYSDYFNLTDPGLKTYKLYAGLAMSLPLLDGGFYNARVGQLQAQRTALAERRRDTELRIRQQVEQAASEMKVALSVWPSDSSRVEASAEALRLAEAGYAGGTSTATEVRDAEAALSDARAEEAQTSMDYWIARAELDHATAGAADKEK